MIVTGLLLALIAVASVTDVRSRKIFNWNVYPGMLAALALNAAAALYTEEIFEVWQPMVGWVGIGECLKGFLACGLVMLICFVFFGLGGGDVKLMAMAGAFLGLEQGLKVLLWTFILGGCLGLSVLIWRIGAIRLLDRGLRQLMALTRWGTSLRLSEEERKELKTELFLAPCALAAVLIVRLNWLEIW